ncbi:MAG TPA: hypothetical protein VK453_14695 [Micromonosporaceae bacterium]|nr:hypothetical protein [Micromonosporaceae bacterium]
MAAGPAQAIGDGNELGSGATVGQTAYPFDGSPRGRFVAGVLHRTELVSRV